MFTIMIIGLAVFSIIKIILFFYFYQQFERKQKEKLNQTTSKDSPKKVTLSLQKFLFKSLESVQSAHFQAF